MPETFKCQIQDDDDEEDDGAEGQRPKSIRKWENENEVKICEERWLVHVEHELREFAATIYQMSFETKKRVRKKNSVSAKICLPVKRVTKFAIYS